MSELKDKIEAIKKRVKHGKLKIQHKDIKDQVLKDVKPEDRERDEICKKARKKAHSVTADAKRDMSNSVRKHLNTLSEGYDFIEESYGTGDPEFTFYDEPQKSEVSESFSVGNNGFHTIGVAEGVLAPIGVMSRNNRIYDEDHYDCILDEKLMNKVQSRGMLGTIGHHDKRVDDEDLANGTVSHIVTDLRIVEEADGTRNLYGKLEIMDTPAGNLLKTYYEHGVPLYVSSRGAGKLLNVPNESYKRVDKNNYFLETFDIVKDPGFLQAKPNYVKEGLEEPETNNDNNIIGEDNMAKKQTVPAIDAEMDSQEMINKLLNPLKEQLAELTDAVKLLSDKVLDVEEVAEAEEVKEDIEATEEVVEEIKEEATEEVSEEEIKKETEDDESEKPADVAEAKEEVTEEATEEVVEESVEEKSEEVSEEEIKKETEDDESEKKADVAESVEEATEEVVEEKTEEVVEEKCDCGDDKKEDDKEECDEAKKDEEAEKLEADAKVDDAKADKLEKDAEKDEEEIEEAKAEDKEELEADEKEDKAKAEELKADAEEDREDAEEIKEEATEEVVEEKCDDEKEDEDKEEKCDESSENDEIINNLVEMVSKASARCKATVEKYEAVCKELNAYKLSEELSITIDEAKEKLETKSYEEIKEEASQKVEESVEEVVEEKVEEPVVESKKATKPVFSRFAGLNESKKSGKKGFSIFG